MTKHLFLLRHAEKASNAFEKDIPLSDKGFDQALALGAHLKNLGIFPARIICSPALRTKQTLSSLLQGLETEVETVFEDHLYYGSVGDMLSLCQDTHNGHESILIVGHNPMIPQFLSLLCTRESYIENQHPIFRGQYHPCTLSMIELTSDDWATIQPYENNLVQMIYTKDLDPEL